MALFDEKGISLFGLEITKAKRPGEDKSAAVSLPVDDEGGSIVSAASGAGYYGIYYDTNSLTKDDIALIQRCREIALYPEIDIAIQDIVNEAIPHETNTPMVTLDLDNLEYSDELKELINKEFKYVLSLLKYEQFASDIFRRWYIDGRLFYQVIVDKANLKRGIVELRVIEATKIRKIKEVRREKSPNYGIDIVAEVKEYFVYQEAGFIPQQGANSSVQVTGSATQGSSQGIRLSPDSVIFCSSGYIDGNTNNVLSHLSKAIRPANQLRMLEDAAVVYVIARAPERRIFYVDVGNLPKLKAEQYVKDIMNRYRNKMVYDAKTGEVRDDKKYMCLAMDTKVPLLDGRTLSIEEIAAEHTSGKKLWAYSCDPVTGEFVPGLITWAGETRKNAEVIRLTLDNGKEIVCTPDHKFPVWNKGFIEAKDLIVGESMVPHYTKQQVIQGKNKNSSLPYLQIFENDKKKWSYVHRLVSKWKDSCKIQNVWMFEEHTETMKTVHHCDFNKNNNSPDNLVRMNASDHTAYHLTNTNIIPFEVRSAAGKKGGKAAYEMKVGVHGLSEELRREVTSKAGKVGGKKSAENGASQENYAKGREKLAELMLDPEWNEEFREKQRKGWSLEARALASERAKSRNLSALGNARFNNHKIAKIEFLVDRTDTGCITIDGDELYHGHHTFALDAGIYTKNSMLEDFWMPRRDNSKGTEIQTLPGAGNIQGAIDNLEYFQKKLYQSLNIPISRLQGQEGFSLGNSGEISRDELKFQKFIDKLRRKFSQLLLESLQMQLVLKGICNNLEWDEKFKENIHIEFQKDNFFTELKNQELLTQRMTLIPQLDPYMGKFFSKKWIQKNVLMMDDDDIEQMEEEIEEEKDDPTAQPTQQGGMDPSMMGGMPGDPSMMPGEDPNAPPQDGQDDQDQQQMPPGKKNPFQ